MIASFRRKESGSDRPEKAKTQKRSQQKAPNRAATPGTRECNTCACLRAGAKCWTFALPHQAARPANDMSEGPATVAAWMDASVQDMSEGPATLRPWANQGPTA